MTGGVDAMDRAVVTALQAGLPLVERPYAEVAAGLGMDEGELKMRLRAMLADGRIRRIAAVPNHYRLGYTANGMTVWDVPDTEVDAVGRRLAGLSHVSHCYRRPRRGADWPYNLFAMIHAADRATVERYAEEMTEMIGPSLRGRDILYSTRILKKAGLRLPAGRE